MSVKMHTVERYYIPGFSVNKADRFVKASDYDALADLLRHCQIHSGYRNCGYSQMTTEQKNLYDALALMDGEKKKGVRA